MRNIIGKRSRVPFVPRLEPGPASRHRGEARAKIVYERLINFCDDAGTEDALQLLMTRIITHMKAFALALERMGKPAFSIGRIAPTPGLVDQFSTGDAVLSFAVVRD